MAAKRKRKSWADKFNEDVRRRAEAEERIPVGNRRPGNRFTMDDGTVVTTELVEMFPERGGLKGMADPFTATGWRRLKSPNQSMIERVVRVGNASCFAGVAKVGDRVYWSASTADDGDAGEVRPFWIHKGVPEAKRAALGACQRLLRASKRPMGGNFGGLRRKRRK